MKVSKGKYIKEMEAIQRAVLCRDLHKLPSELDNEPVENLTELMVVLGGIAQGEKNRRK